MVSCSTKQIYPKAGLLISSKPAQFNFSQCELGFYAPKKSVQVGCTLLNTAAEQTSSGKKKGKR